MRDLYYGWRGFLEWVALGYAIVAVDYAGLGTEVVHQYIAAPAQANDVLFAVPAARAAVPELGRKWVAIGHSQGGTAVVAVAEMQSELQDPDYLGALALAPVGDVEAIFSTIDASPVRGYAVFLSYGVKAVHAEFEHADMLTPDAVRLMSGLKTDGWAVTLARVADRIPPGKVMRPDWRENRHLQEFRRMSLLGSRRASGPVLLLAGDADGTVRAPTVEAAYQRMREQGSEVELRVGAGLDHDPLVFETFPEQLAWVQDRFGGRPATAGN